MEQRTQKDIHDKGFNFGSAAVLDYGKIKLNSQTLEDATLNLGALAAGKKNLANKGLIMKALAEQDIKTLREISNYFYRTNGIYMRVCEYFAKLYHYDWYIVAETYGDSVNEGKVVKEFSKILTYLDNSYIKKLCGDIALRVIRDGAYYGYIVDSAEGLVLQELPINYCRSYYNIGHRPAVEFNMRYFDDQFSDINYRMKVLKMFPPEFAKGYILYKQGKLQDINPVGGNNHSATASGWYLLEPGSTIKFNMSENDTPLFVNACPAILDLDAAQALDRRKQMQKLLKVLVQKLPLDKNGDLIFDVDEAKDIHQNAVEMLRRAIGVDVLTTFTDVMAIDMADKNSATSTDDLERVERSVYNNFGISSNLFNSTGNISQDKSIMNDESYMRSLLFQLAVFFDYITQKKSSNRKKVNFRFYMLETTQYNYKELSKMYKEQTQLGFSKMLPQIALGHSQSMIINTIYFENEILHLSEIMLPPMQSSTMNADALATLGKNGQGNNNKTQQNTTEKDGSTGQAGRPEKPDDQKSDKTIANRESKG